MTKSIQEKYYRKKRVPNITDQGLHCTCLYDPVRKRVWLVYVHVQKRAGDQYQCNERDKDSDYFHPVAKRILIMQNDIFSIILIHEVNKIYDFIKCLS